MKIDEIRSLAQIMEEAGLTGLEISEPDLKVKLEKRPAAPEVSAGVPAALQAAGAALQPQSAARCDIRCPMVGVFYAAPAPESEPYVRVGSAVRKGDVVCVVEAMKLLNEISADQDGEIAEICAENGSVVEYGQTLFRLR